MPEPLRILAGDCTVTYIDAAENRRERGTTVTICKADNCCELLVARSPHHRFQAVPKYHVGCSRFCRMRRFDTVWATLEQWGPIALLLAGGLFVLPAAASGFEAVTGTGINLSPAVIFLFLLVAFVGLLGLYPALAERGSLMALGGVGTLAATAAIILSTFGVAVLPLGLTIGKATALVIVASIAVGAALTVSTFGVACTWTGAHPRPVGISLLVAGAAMALMVVAMVLYGDATPAWVGAVVNGLVAISLGASGYTLRRAGVPTGRAEATNDVTAS